MKEREQAFLGKRNGILFPWKEKWNSLSLEREMNRLSNDIQYNANNTVTTEI